jgi:3-phenylpropionate/trans-cinnamate dioxygenase ferredoxin subunit
MNEYVKVTKAADIGAGTMKGFTINETKILVANVGGKYYAVEDRCTHMNAKLSTGMLMGNIIMCMAHGAQFDVTTGAVLASPANKPTKAYEVRVNGDDIEIKL